ncbi:MAG TPA: DNA polymerase III subunit alpha, partial [Rhabdochlamydiaceae bacterium]
IQKAVDAVKKSQGLAIDWVRLPLDDKETFSLLNHGHTLGVFQLESGGMTDLSKQLHIDKFEEIIAVGALYRPGPMEMIPSFINRKHGRESLDIDHPLMKDILSETYGIMVYQEQVMQIASRLAGYSLGEGDVLRRAMGKKDKEEMSKQRDKFREGALKNDIDVATSMRVFDKIEKFASYGFNKSHAAAYGFLTYVTAYMKAHYPKEWMAALMTTDLDDISKVARIIRECQAMSIAILPPDVNESDIEFVATPRGVRFALSAIKGVGEGVVEVIIAERNRSGAFLSLYDFLKRIDTKKVGKKVVEHLAEAGCFDFTGWSRKALLASVDPMYASASKDQKETSRGVIDLFSLIETAQPEFSAPPAVEGEVPKQHLLKREKELLGFYLTGHPMDDFREQIQGLSCIPFHELAELEHDELFRAAFIVESVQLRISSKSQRKFAILTISDGMEQFELPIWPELYEEKGHLLVDNQLLIAVLQVDKKEEALKLQCKWLGDLTNFDEKACNEAYDRAKRQGKMNDKIAKQKKDEVASQLTLKIDAEVCRLSHILELKDLFRTYPGNCSIHIEFCVNDQKVSALAIDSTWGISLHPQLEERLRTFPSIKSIKKQDIL